MSNRINFLPPWVETNIQPAFYDKESGTCLQQTARMYAKVNQLVRSVNDQNETIADYIQKFIDLKDYVDDYFDNLDVQEEINKKLDDMTIDGTLTSIVGEYVSTDIQPSIDAIDDRVDVQNTRIDNLQSQIQSVASGSPAGVYATLSDLTTADPNHSKIYVVQSTGKWYYWNSSSNAWAAGGNYQSVLNTAVDDAKQAYSTLKARLNDELAVNDNVIEEVSMPLVSVFTKGGITNEGDFTTTDTRARNAFDYFYDNTQISIKDKDYQFNLFEFSRTNHSFIRKITDDWVSSYVLTAPEGRNTTNSICIVVKHKDNNVLSDATTLEDIRRSIIVTPLDFIYRDKLIAYINNTALENTEVKSDMTTVTNQKYGTFDVYRQSYEYLTLKANPNFKFKVIRCNEKGNYISFMTNDWVYTYTFTEKCYFRVMAVKINEDDIISSNRSVYVENTKSELDINDYSTIHEFTPFDTNYECPADNYKENSITSSDFINTFYTPLLGSRSNGVFVGRKVLGKDQSDTYNIYEFEFKPADNNYKHTILISSGMHGYELPAPFGVARWIKEYMESNDPTFVWLRKNVRIKVIPIINPYGFNKTPNKRYGNVNGVNINRNFNDIYDTWYSFPNFAPNPDGEHEDGTIDPESGLPYNEFSYKGTAPFSENETKILRDWVYDNTDAKYWIDCHTGATNNNGEIWLTYLSVVILRAKLGYGNHMLEDYYYNKYGVAARKHIELDSPASIRQSFSVRSAGVPTFTLEQSAKGNMFGGNDNNNSSEQIVNYALQLNNYILQLLKS